jgi:hypothetical protein
MKKGGADLISSTTTFTVTRGHGARQDCMLDAVRSACDRCMPRSAPRPINAADQRARPGRRINAQ